MARVVAGIKHPQRHVHAQRFTVPSTARCIRTGKHHIGCRKTRLRVALNQRHAVLAPLQPGGSQARQASPHHGPTTATTTATVMTTKG